MARLAIVGGTGLSQYPELQRVDNAALDTPYGAPSAAALIGRLGGHEVVFLPRHGEGHTLPPHRINYRANLWCLQQLGVKKILAVNAVGGIHPAMGPGHLCIPDQIIDYTYGREHTFADGTAKTVQHIDFSYPYDPVARQILIRQLTALQMPYSDFGVYGCTQGPRLESAAEIRRLAADGCDLVGMTGMPEAALARELEIDYVSICMVVNWAAGIEAAPIDMADLMRTLENCTREVKRLIAAVAGALIV
ncbi:S-methyl-5'-thioinosine phosphorylase [Exilibacterium tricleocarpae]|uniref:Probable S-methyl-5'-thioinosine phosphorylase n=1 Tax=Exilibacterium tricleocarpae TaxID=2591008 RepID=A0A545TVV7_9GAMM|nr:S-methyl-5'-thioinosine phosphorylase [Exilibacterium tricleocarpae]TQV81355.1 S-methyl-5'-thioinosine phosphorylase [Exilibacterium tricleocarpae]